MTIQPTAEHYLLATKLKNETNGGWLEVCARQLALADAEAERVRKVAEEGFRLMSRLDRYPATADCERAAELFNELFKSLLPAEPEVDPLVEAIQKVWQYARGCEHVTTMRAEELRAALAKQGFEIKEKG